MMVRLLTQKCVTRLNELAMVLMLLLPIRLKKSCEIIVMNDFIKGNNGLSYYHSRL